MSKIYGMTMDMSEKALYATILRNVGDTWISEEVNILHRSFHAPEKCYVFLPKSTYKHHVNPLEFLSGQFKDIPRFVFENTCIKSNGYFGCKPVYNNADCLESYFSWFRCLIKAVGGTQEQMKASVLDYTWYEMGFYTQWNANGQCKVFCIDTPDDMPQKLLHTLNSNAVEALPRHWMDPFTLHFPLLDQVLSWYDKSIWQMRDQIRQIEKTRSLKPAFLDMHESLRHTIHVVEILSVTVSTIEKLLTSRAVIHQNLSSYLSKSYTEQTREYAQFQLNVVESLKLRSQSNGERLRNEVNLAHDIIAHQDNQIMKSIAFLGMIFLPATFMSALFSTTFFSFSQTGWEISDKFWIYWVVTIPMTALVMLIWRVWLRNRKHIVHHTSENRGNKASV